MYYIKVLCSEESFALAATPIFFGRSQSKRENMNGKEDTFETLRNLKKKTLQSYVTKSDKLSTKVPQPLLT